MNEIRNYGLLINKEKDVEAYVFGSGSLPELVLQEDGQWDNFLPVYEPQFNSFFDSYGCTVWGTLNALEILLKKLKGVEYNFSERFIYILAKVMPPGADPHHVAETIRNNGVIENALLPMTPEQDFVEFLKPNPMTKALLEKGLAFPFEFKHEYVFQSLLTKEERTKKIKQALRLSPLGVSVTAWFQEGGVYVDKDKPNTHWVVCYGWNAQGWKVFDSYNQSTKIVSFDHKMQQCKRYYPQPSTRLPQISLIGRILILLKSLLGLKQAEEASIPTPTTNSSLEPVLPQIKPSVVDFAGVIKVYEGWIPPNNKYPTGSVSWRNKNPGNIKDKWGNFLRFPSEEGGFAYLCDYIKRVATNQHPAYPKDCDVARFFAIYAPSIDSNDPQKYAKFVADRLGIVVSAKIKDMV